jgi:uncharacterized membrane protein YeaQ/YmgE (transglycosylase-associated protein family)
LHGGAHWIEVGQEEAVVSIIAWILMGLLAGVLATMIMPGDDPGGLIVTILIGIAGAMVGGFIATGLGIGQGVDDFDFGSLITAILGAMILLLGYRMVARRT